MALVAGSAHILVSDFSMLFDLSNLLNNGNIELLIISKNKLRLLNLANFFIPFSRPSKIDNQRRCDFVWKSDDVNVTNFDRPRPSL